MTASEEATLADVAVVRVRRGGCSAGEVTVGRWRYDQRQSRSDGTARQGDARFMLAQLRDDIDDIVRGCTASQLPATTLWHGCATGHRLVLFIGIVVTNAQPPAELWMEKPLHD